MTDTIRSDRWQRSDRLVNTVTGETGTIIGFIRGNPAIPHSVKIAIDVGGIAVGQQSALEKSGWSCQCHS